MGQSPCYVADVLMTECIGHRTILFSYNRIYPESVELMVVRPAYNMIPLAAPGQAYVIPEAPSNPACYCNSIWYSLSSACAVCQNGTWLTYVNVTCLSKNRKPDRFLRWPEYTLYCHGAVYLVVWVQSSVQD